MCQFSEIGNDKIVVNCLAPNPDKKPGGKKNFRVNGRGWEGGGREREERGMGGGFFLSSFWKKDTIETIVRCSPSSFHPVLVSASRIIASFVLPFTTPRRAHRYKTHP
jgi:hypothetical protein